jgi:hypothetical protein
MMDMPNSATMKVSLNDIRRHFSKLILGGDSALENIIEKKNH